MRMEGRRQRRRRRRRATSNRGKVRANRRRAHHCIRAAGVRGGSSIARISKGKGSLRSGRTTRQCGCRRTRNRGGGCRFGRGSGRATRQCGCRWTRNRGGGSSSARISKGEGSFRIGRAPGWRTRQSRSEKRLICKSSSSGVCKRRNRHLSSGSCGGGC